jgi:hypothetical protein
VFTVRRVADWTRIDRKPHLISWTVGMAEKQGKIEKDIEMYPIVW